MVEEALAAAGARAGQCELEFRANYFGMGYRWIRAQYASLVGEDGTVYRVVGRLDDIQAEKEREQSLEDKARRDAMTGFLNHDASRQSIEKAPPGRPGGGTLFVLDIDDFKRVNDEIDIRISVSNAVRELFRHGDILGRFGGDEFVAFMPGVCSETLAATRAEAILESIRRIQVGSISGICCSIGVAITRRTHARWDELFHLADVALYEAKHSGKGSYALRLVDQEPSESPWPRSQMS